ncbi:MAG: hypothetical protein JWP25_7714 [Bradyrhizobium sp.]|jgi:hypothetical protein|nr:hypothetical protein [Bradyrhizobium sp.]
MCWNGQASAVLATIGLGTTAYTAYKKEPVVLWASLGYFSLMELLQAFTYSVIDQCSLPSNQVATLLGYMHIAFQPFFINAVSLHFIPDEVRRKIEPSVYALCLASTVFMMIQVYPFAWAGHCDSNSTLCSLRLCSVSGNWHIAWDVPVNGIGNGIGGSRMHGFPTYSVVAFLLPLLFGSWRFTLFQWLAGPLLAEQTTSNLNEWPAVWCLLSIGLLSLAIKSPLRRVMYVRHWWLWPSSWRPQGEPAVAVLQSD